MLIQHLLNFQECKIMVGENLMQLEMFHYVVICLEPILSTFKKVCVALHDYVLLFQLE